MKHQLCINDRRALCLFHDLHAVCLSTHLSHPFHPGNHVLRRALAPPLPSSSSLALALHVLPPALRDSFRCVPPASSGP